MSKISIITFSIFVSILLVSCQKHEEPIIVKIDLNKINEPISKFIYGQFIEHLGNCIYNGIWAEMLEDRKFYYPITDNFNPNELAPADTFWNTAPFEYLAASPWEVIGKTGIIKMQKENTYVGEFTPEINCTENSISGIRQYNIGLIKRREYNGRIILSGDETVLPINIQLIDGETKQQIASVNEINKNYTTSEFKFTSNIGSENAIIEITSSGRGKFRIGTISMMPANNIDGWRFDVVNLLKELNSPIYRWPGGNFVSGYNWKDGIGERDKRPPRKNPAWKGVEHNDVGIHEYMNLMNILNSEAFIAVNTGSGTPDQVAEEIAYCRADNSNPMGKWRIENGHPEPYDVKYWAVGNEMYGAWQIGHMPLEEYVKKHNSTADAIWKIDSTAQLIGVGAVGDWSESMLKVCSNHMNLISEHHYSREIDTNITLHVNQIAEAVKSIADSHRVYRARIPELKDRDIRIALDEWNYWYGDYIYGELGVNYHMKDALGIAKGLHEIFRNSDLYYMANYAQTVNVIGCIKTTDIASGFASTGQVLKLYRKQFENIPLNINAINQDIDIAASISEDKKNISIAMVNSSAKSETIQFELSNFNIDQNCVQWIIQNSNPESYNTPGKKEEIGIVESKLELEDNEINLPALSIVLINGKIIN